MVMGGGVRGWRGVTVLRSFVSWWGGVIVMGRSKRA